MALKLVVMTNAAGDVLELMLQHARYGVGRAPDNELRINENYISGHHAALEKRDDGGYSLEDLGSSNGTFLNGRRLTGSEPIQAGDSIKFGILKVAVKDHDEAGPEIVAWKDRPSLSRDKGSATAPVSPAEPKTGAIALADSGDLSEDPEETPSDRAPAALQASPDEVPEATHPEEELRILRAEADQLRLDLCRAEETSRRERKEVESSLRARLAQLERELVEEQDRAREAASARDRLDAQRGTLEPELESLRRESAQLRALQEEAARQNGRLQAELHQVTAERAELSEGLESARERTNGLLDEVESLKAVLEGKDRELAERELHHVRAEAETAQRLKREISDALAASATAEERAKAAYREKQTLAGAFDRLREQMAQSESARIESEESRRELLTEREALVHRLDKAEASRSELAARIKEDALAALVQRELIQKLERQLKENEFAAVQREHDRVHALEAELSRAGRRAAEDERRRHDLEMQLVRSTSACQEAEARALTLEARLVECEAEAASVRAKLGETEKSRVDLAAKLAAESSLVASHARTIEGLRREFSASLSRYSAEEIDLITRHGEETETLLAELRTERARREELEVRLANTRAGFSDALRHSREAAERDRAGLTALGLAKLSVVEEQLSEAIHAREAVAASRSKLEDELNEREAELEFLAEKLEDLELRLADEIETRQTLLSELARTRAGFSEILRFAWSRMTSTESALAEQRAEHLEVQTALVAVRDEASRLGKALAAAEHEHRAEILCWEQRHEALREEKATLSGESAELKRLRQKVQAAASEKRRLDEAVATLERDLADLESRQGELRSEREHLLAGREELKSALNAGRLELELLKKRNAEAKAEEAKQSETITAAERRIQSLRKLETEIEQAVERRCQKQRLSRGEVFNESSFVPEGAEGFSPTEFYRQLIAKLDLIDDLAKRYENKWLYPKVAEQLGVLKRAFVDFLKDHSVKPFGLDPGTELSLTERKRIKLVPVGGGLAGNANGNGTGSGLHRSRVVETLRPGYVYESGSQAIVLRKAEVLVS